MAPWHICGTATTHSRHASQPAPSPIARASNTAGSRVSQHAGHLVASITGAETPFKAVVGLRGRLGADTRIEVVPELTVRTQQRGTGIDSELNVARSPDGAPGECASSTGLRGPLERGKGHRDAIVCSLGTTGDLCLGVCTELLIEHGNAPGRNSHDSVTVISSPASEKVYPHRTYEPPTTKANSRPLSATTTLERVSHVLSAVVLLPVNQSPHPRSSPRPTNRPCRPDSTRRCGSRPRPCRKGMLRNRRRGSSPSS